MHSSNWMPELWLCSLERITEKGLSDTELDSIIAVSEKSSLSAPHLFWTSEHYAFGKCFREWLSWPQWLPIPVYGDHGVCQAGLLAPHEQENPSHYHFLWGSSRYSYAKLFTKKNLIRVPHPWVTYRHRKGYKPRPDRKGTLVFFPHSTMAVELDNYSLDQYMKELSLLPDKYQPIILCLHRHDIFKGLHKVLRQYDFPLVSAGNPSSPFFVDRFYSLLSCFRYATSPLGGSELFYCYEFGIQYFIYGSTPEYINKEDKNLPVGKLERLDIVYQKNHDLKMKLFQNLNPEPSAEKTDFVLGMLGLDCTVSLNKLKTILLIELLRLTPYYLKNNIFPRIFKKLQSLKHKK